MQPNTSIACSRSFEPKNASKARVTSSLHPGLLWTGSLLVTLAATLFYFGFHLTSLVVIYFKNPVLMFSVLLRWWSLLLLWVYYIHTHTLEDLFFLKKKRLHQAKLTNLTVIFLTLPAWLTSFDHLFTINSTHILKILITHVLKHMKILQMNHDLRQRWRKYSDLLRSSNTMQ